MFYSSFSNTETILAATLVFVLLVLFYVTHKLHRVLKQQRTKEFDKRLKLLEKELNSHVYRSERRIDIFRKVVDGFDTMVTGVRGVLQEDERLKKEISGLRGEVSVEEGVAVPAGMKDKKVIE